jgi:hypothetical protein
MYEVKSVELRGVNVTSNDVEMGVATTVSVEGSGAAFATSTRASLATDAVAGSVRAVSAALKVSNDQMARG